MKTLVVGATGLVGLEVCRALARSSHEVRALVRATADAGRRGELEALGIELVHGDLKDEASLARACSGVRAVISTASSTLSRQPGDSIATVDERGQLALVDAARAAGVGHFVFVSFRDDPQVQYPLTVAKRAVERRLASSGMAYTILQASYFMEVWLTPALGFDVAARRVRLFGDGTRPISWVSYHDVAGMAAAAIDQPAARNRTVQIGGPDALSQRDVVRLFEKAGAGAIATEQVTEAELAEQLAAARDPMEQTFAGLMLQCVRGDAVDAPEAAMLFPFERRSVQAFVMGQLRAHLTGDTA